MTLLSVNINKVAVLRNSRGGLDPELLPFAKVCVDAGAGGITVHPRPDQRHIIPADVDKIGAFCRGRCEFNIEGNPFAAARAEYPGLLAMVRATRPSQVTLVPDDDGQITSDHGFDPDRDAERLSAVVAELRACGCRVSVFVDAGCTAFEAFAGIGVDRVELYTGPYASALAKGSAEAELRACARSAEAATRAGLAVNAGHDLSLQNLERLLRRVPQVAEVSIGHALVSEALYLGLEETVKRYVQLIERTRRCPGSDPGIGAAADSCLG